LSTPSGTVTTTCEPSSTAQSAVTTRTRSGDTATSDTSRPSVPSSRQAAKYPYTVGQGVMWNQRSGCQARQADRGRRYGVIVQANELLPRSAVLVAPTSPSARAASFRPEIELLGETTRVLVEQAGVIDAGRLGDLVGQLTPEQQWGIDEALTTVLGLR